MHAKIRVGKNAPEIRISSRAVRASGRRRLDFFRQASTSPNPQVLVLLHDSRDGH
jgi:hypothetical protein